MIDGRGAQGIEGTEGVGDLVLQKVLVSLLVCLLSGRYTILHELYGYQQTLDSPWRQSGGGCNAHGIEPIYIDVVGNGDDAVAAWKEHQRHQRVLKEIAFREMKV